MAYMAKKKNELSSVKEIAEGLKISANHLSKVLQRLVKEDLVKSIKGYGGGFKLAKRPEDITFLEIYEAIDGRFKPSNCLLGRNDCNQNCVMGCFLETINNQTEEFFKSKKLTDFKL